MSDNVAVISENEQTAKYYGGTVTVLGRELITSLMAGQTIEFTRIVVGSGEMPEGVEPIDMTDLVVPVAEGVSSVPTVENSVMSMIVEYRNDLNGGLKQGFWLREFGIYAKTAEMDEVLLYYATLGNSPQPVNAYKDNRIDIRRYPVSIALEVDADIEITYNPGSFVTSKEVHDLVKSEMQTSAMEIIDDRIDAALADRSNNVGSAIIRNITIPAAGWVPVAENAEGVGDYKYTIDIAMTEATEEHFPSVALDIGSLEIAADAEMCPTIQTLDGIVRFWAMTVPTADLTGTILLRSENLVDMDIATDDEVDDTVDDVFGDQGDLPSGYQVATDEEVNQTITDIFGQKP